MAFQHTMSADGGGFSAGAARRSTDGTGAADDAYKQLPDAITGLERALDNAITLDEQKSSSFWQELKQFGEHGFNYWADKARFERECRQLVADAKAAVKRVRTVADKAISHSNAPDHLATIVDQWQAVIDSGAQVKGEVPQLQTVEGWGGPNADNYGVMTGVQVQAVTEYDSMPTVGHQAAEKLRGDNLIILNLVYQGVARATGGSQVCIAGGENEFYVNTANVLNQARTCYNSFPPIAKEGAEDSGSGLGEVLDTALATPVVIAEGWPTGMGQAGKEAHTPAATGMPEETYGPGYGPYAPDRDGVQR